MDRSTFTAAQPAKERQFGALQGKGFVIWDKVTHERPSVHSSRFPMLLPEQSF